MSMRRDEVLDSLKGMLEETARARDLTATGEAIPAMRALLRARSLGRRSVVALMGDCLRAAAAEADQASLSRLIELIEFSQRALCPRCLSQVGKRWKEANDV